MEEAGRGRWKKFTAEAGRSSPRWVEEVERGTQTTGHTRDLWCISAAQPTAKKPWEPMLLQRGLSYFKGE